MREKVFSDQQPLNSAGHGDPADSDERRILEVNENSGEYRIRIMPRGLIESAEAGDRDSITELARIAADIIERELNEASDSFDLKKQELGVLYWLIDSLNSVAQGTAPDISFRWKIDGAGGGRRKPGIIERQRRQIAAANVVGLLKSGQARTIDDAIAKVADRMHRSPDLIWRYYKEYKDIPIRTYGKN